MTGLYRGIALPDGRLLSTEQTITYDGIPVRELVIVDVFVGPDETEDEDMPEAAE